MLVYHIKYIEDTCIEHFEQYATNCEKVEGYKYLYEALYVFSLPGSFWSHIFLSWNLQNKTQGLLTPIKFEQINAIPFCVPVMRLSCNQACQLIFLSTKEEGEPDGGLLPRPVKQKKRQLFNKQRHRMRKRDEPKDLSDTQLFPEFLCPAFRIGNFWAPPRGCVCVVSVHVCVCVCFLWMRELRRFVNEYIRNTLAGCPLLF